MFVRYSIACKEARETHDWLRRLAESEVLPTERPAPITQACYELIAILTSIVKKTRDQGRT